MSLIKSQVEWKFRTSLIRLLLVLLLVFISATNIWKSMVAILVIDEHFYNTTSLEAEEEKDTKGHNGVIVLTEAPSTLQLTPPCEDDSSACNLPKWMKEYFRWHRESLGNITQPSDWQKYRIFILRCMDGDSCGGTADRLRPLPLYLAIAARSKRLFFIRWNKPVPLEVLLEPFQLNWAMPADLAQLVDQKNGTTLHVRNLENMAEKSPTPDLWALQGLSQSMAYVELYKKVVVDLEEFSNGEPSILPADYFHDLFLALFRPIPDLRDMIERIMNQLHLIPNHYTVTHIRALYPGLPFEQSQNISDLEPSVLNAIDCTSYILGDAPVFVAADALAVKVIAREYGRNRRSFPVVSDIDLDNSTEAYNSTDAYNSTEADPTHIDFAQNKDPTAYFGVFSDLFIMSQSRCVTYGMGGFGRFGALASFNSSCKVQHTGNAPRGRILKCPPPKRT